MEDSAECMLVLIGATPEGRKELMVFKLVMTAGKSWRRLKGENQLPKVISGIKFVDGVESVEAPSQTAA